MTPTIVASTPSPPPGIRTPPTPRHGFSDPWEPYSPRKSARISAQRASNRTPPPPSSSSQLDPFSSSSRKHRTHTSSVAGMATPMESPKKKSRATAMDSNGPGQLLGYDNKLSTGHLSSSTTTVSRSTGMLPTPAKTPKKAPAEKNPAIQAIARNLFPSDDELMPNPRKSRPKKFTGISMDSFTAEEDEQPIEIFTDSRERIPNKVASAENPFWGEASRAQQEEPVRRRSKRRQVHVPGEGRQTVEEALEREDGMVYVFRGKKIFRKFQQPDSGDGDGADQDGSASPTRRITRSSIKPRLLFPTKPQSAKQLEDEEADTDVEVDMTRSDAEEEAEDACPETPAVEDPSDRSHPATPKAPGYSPVSPPDTRRVTRARDRKVDEGSPTKPQPQRKQHHHHHQQQGRTSPFDSWPRVKSRSESSGASNKRAGSSLSSSTAKKARP